MQNVFATTKPPFIRIDFTNDVVWQEIVYAVQKPSEDGFLASLSIIDDESLSAASMDDVFAAVPAVPRHAILFIVDQETIMHSDHPILCIALLVPGKSLRVTPSEMWNVENNLSLANVDFEEFSEAVGADGIFRGFK